GDDGSPTSARKRSISPSKSNAESHSAFKLGTRTPSAGNNARTISPTTAPKSTTRPLRALNFPTIESTSGNTVAIAGPGKSPAVRGREITQRAMSEVGAHSSSNAAAPAAPDRPTPKPPSTPHKVTSEVSPPRQERKRGSNHAASALKSSSI